MLIELKITPPINIIDDGVWRFFFFDFFLGVSCCVFLLFSLVHRLEYIGTRTSFFSSSSFFLPRLCVGCCTQPAVYSSLKYSTPPLACCRLVRLLRLAEERETRKKKKKTLLPSHHFSRTKRDLSHRAHILWIYSRLDRSPRLITSNYSEETRRRKRNKLFSIFLCLKRRRIFFHLYITYQCLYGTIF